MASYNKVILVGNLTRDPELRYTPSGKAIAKLGLAVNRRWTAETGEQREEVTFIDIDAFGKQAETISQYMKKGGAMLVEGRLRLDQWDDKQSGQKRSKLGVILEGFQFMGGRPEGSTGVPSSAPVAARPVSRPQAPSAAPSPAAPPPEEEMGHPEGDDVPF